MREYEETFSPRVTQIPYDMYVTSNRISVQTRIHVATYICDNRILVLQHAVTCHEIMTRIRMLLADILYLTFSLNVFKFKNVNIHFVFVELQSEFLFFSLKKYFSLKMLIM